MNMVHNGTSENLREHAQPIVLLERLEDLSSVTLGSKEHTSTALTITSEPSTSIVNNPNHESNQQGSSYNTRAATARQHKLSRKKKITPRLPMHLRSRVIMYNDANEAVPYKKKNFIKDRKRVTASARKLRTKKRQQRAVEEFSNDDDQPLTFFRKKTLRGRKDRNMQQRTLKCKRPKSGKNSGQSWNLCVEEECQVCRTALYLSRVTKVLGKKSELCQHHALAVINDCKEDLTGIVTDVSMTSSDLDEIILNLQKQRLSRQ